MAPGPGEECKEPRPVRPRQPDQCRTSPGDEPGHFRVWDLDRLGLDPDPGGGRLDPAVQPHAALDEDGLRRGHFRGCSDAQRGVAAEGLQRLAEAVTRPGVCGEIPAHG